MPLPRPTRAVATIVASILVLSACGGGSTADDLTTAAATVGSRADETSQTPTTDAGEPATEPGVADDVRSSESDTSAGGEPAAEASAENEPAPEADAANNELPDVNVIDIATGDELNLRTLAPADQPIVFWFWAPH